MSKAPDIDQLTALLPALIAALKNDLASKTNAMAALKKAGLIYASEHWRERKYMYLIYPTAGGQRVRQYVGTDPKKIARAQAAIERAKAYDVLKRQADEIAYTLREGYGIIQEAASCLGGVRRW